MRSCLRRVIIQPGLPCRGLSFQRFRPGVVATELPRDERSRPTDSCHWDCRTSSASNRRSLYACQRVMNAEPPGFDRAALYAALREWELSITSLSYLPLGAGSHHYLARDAAG